MAAGAPDPARLGTLYGIGVGPGDPELVTLKAVRVLGQVDVVFTSAQARSGKSLALEIAAPHLRPGGEVIPLRFPHTFEGLRDGVAHRENAAAVVQVLRRPAAAAFLTLGDPMTYSTFTYLLAQIRKLEPDTPTEVIPGITAFAAAAAAATQPLAEGDESFTVVSASRAPERIEEAILRSDSVVVMKPYRETGRVCDLLDRHGLGETALFAVDCSRPGQQLLRGTEAARRRAPHYLSLFLLRRPKSGNRPP